MANLATVGEAILDAIISKVDAVGAPNTITIANKVEGPLLYWLDDKAEATAYPFMSVYMPVLPEFNEQTLKQIVDTVFGIEIHVLEKAVAGENPYALVRILASNIMDNLLYTGDLGLSYVNYINPRIIRQPDDKLNDYLMWSGTNSAAAVLELDVYCTYEPYTA